MKLKSKDLQKQSLWLLVLFAVFFAAVVFNSDWKTDVHEHVDSNAMFKYHKPESTLKNAINHYTVIHFLQYAAVSIVKVIQLWQVVIFSVFWEIFELYAHFEWGRESWLNKAVDIVFNILGFRFGRTVIANRLNKTPSKI